MKSGESNCVRIGFAGRRTRTAARIITALGLILLTSVSFITAIPFHPAPSSPAEQGLNNLGDSSGASGIQFPRSVGADSVPDLHLPKTVLSNVDKLVSSGGVVQNSPNNLTLYNLAVILRLLGGPESHDELLDRSHNVLSSWMFWNVEAQSGAGWIPLRASSSTFRLLGTNSSGTFVLRTMKVGSGLFSGNFTVVYRATSSGALKWDLSFTASTPGHYSLVYSWHDVSRVVDIPGDPQKLTFPYPASNYTLAWDDVSPSLTVTTTRLPSLFSLRIDIGQLGRLATAEVDPSLVSSTLSNSNTGFTFQRKVFYEPEGGYFFVFYYNGNSIVYASSRDGTVWSEGQMPAYWPGYADNATSDPFIFNAGETVVAAVGQSVQKNFNCPCGPGLDTTGLVSLSYTVGTISGPNISWQQYPSVTSIPRICSTTASTCSLTLAIRYVSVTATSSGQLAFSFNYYANGPLRQGEGDGFCLSDSPTESDVVALYMGAILYADCEPDGLGMKSVVVPADAQGGIRLIYQFHSGSSIQLRTRLIGGQKLTFGPVNPTADTYVSSNFDSDNRNFGGDTRVSLTAATLGLTGLTGEQDILIDFTMLPRGAMVINANLTLTSYGQGYNVGADTVYVYQPNSAWTESGVTFDNRPGVEQSSMAAKWVNFTQYPSGSVLSLDVTNPVRSDYQGSTGDRGLILELNATSPNNIPTPGITFYSRESGADKSPELSVSYLCCATDPQILEENEDSAGDFSAANDAGYGVHLVYKPSGGNITYQYLASGSPAWNPPVNMCPYSNFLISPTCLSSDPTVTIDYSTGDVYLLALWNPSYLGQSAVTMMKKTPSQGWSPTVFVSVNQPPLSDLASNLYSVSGTNASWVLLTWTSSNLSSNYVWFESVPIQTVWSPFASPTDPWDGYGVAPYGEYFQNLNEYVSTSTGLLIVRQTDLSLPGRGLDLDITRVYTEPYSFLVGLVFNYEAYPWAPIGRGWQLDFPWMVTTPAPAYIHLWNGEGYRVPYSFWLGSGATFENHQGEQFRLVRNGASVILYAKSGVSYSFDSNNQNRLTRITDATGNNSITFYYNNNLISSIVDTVGRTVLFCYSNVMRIIQATGTCASPTGYVRGVTYTGSGSLTKVTDPANRNTTISYDSTGYLITRIAYPTSWATTYSYSASPVGSDATTYRVSSQTILDSKGSTVKQFQYSYSSSPGGEVTGSTVKSFNGTALAGYTDYSFSFAGAVRNSSDANHNLIQGEEDLFNPGGQVVREIVLVSNGITHGTGRLVSSYTNYYEYDSWGNQIYSRWTINGNWSHESFNSYYNDGVPPGFNAFQETFSQNNGTATDNAWSSSNGYWRVQSGALNASLSGQELSSISYDLGIGSISIQANIYLNKMDPCKSVPPSFGIFGHSSWSLRLTNWPTCSDPQVLYLSGRTSFASSSCPIQTSKWYTFNLTIQGLQATGWASTNGQNKCTVSTTFQPYDPFAGSTGFGLIADYASLLFRNITVTTVFPSGSQPGFSNSFITKSAPGTNIHGASAGSAMFQNGTGTQSIESYYSYYPWGGLNQTRQLYSSSSGVQWLISSRTYDGYGNLLRLTDPRGNSTSWGYSANYQSAYLTSRTEVLKPGGAQLTRRYSYNFTVGTLLSSVDANGYNTTYQYDILGRVSRVSYPYTGSTSFEAYNYNDAANYVTITNENGWKTLQIYDGLSRLSKVDRFLNSASYSNRTYGYNWQDKIARLIDERGNTTSYQYDALGRLVQTTEPNNNVTQAFYDDADSRVTTTDEQGNYRCRTYDRLGRLISIVEYSDANCSPLLLNGNNYVTNYYYDEVGNLRKVTTTGSQSTTYGYDSLNRPVQTSNPDNTLTSYTYDSNGNLVNTIDMNGNRTSRSYDSLNRLVNITYYGRTVSLDNYKYDSNGNLVQLQSQNATLGYTYDARNRVLCETYAINKATGISGPCGNGGGGGSVAAGTLITLADGRNVPVQQLTGGMSLLSYNVTTGQPTTSTITSIATVETDNMLVIRTMDGVPLRTDNATIQKLWVKQADGNIGWLSVTLLHTGDYLYLAQQQKWTLVTGIDYVPGHFTMHDIYTTAPYDYLANGYLDPPKSPSGPSTPGGVAQAGYSFQYSYGGERLSSITYNDFSSVTYIYDGLGRILNTTYGTINGPAYYASFSYYPNDQIKTIKYASGLVENIAVDKLSRPVNMTLWYANTKPLQLLYGYNKTGTVATVTGKVNGATVNEAYGYDVLDRLVNSVVKTGTTTTTTSYTYDTAGNRLSHTLNGITTSYVITQSSNELASSTGGGITNSYGYDPDGRVLSRTTTPGGALWSYKWNVQGQLLSASNSSGVQGYYGYDGLGRRVETKEGSSTVFYGYTGTETLAEGSLNPNTDYVYANGLRIAKVTGASGNSPTVVYYHTDVLGSTRLVTSSTRSVLFSDSYQPFGQNNGTPTGSETYKFTGKPYSTGTGLYYYYQRWYDPSTGRFISRDPLLGSVWNPQSQNPYVYVTNTPTSLIDPTGAQQEGQGGCFGNEDCSEPRTTLTGNGITSTSGEGAKPLQIEVNPTPRIADTSPAATATETGFGSLETAPTTPETGQSTRASTGYKFVSTPNGNLIRVPENWEPRVANNGRGLVLQDAWSSGNSNMIRIMDPTTRYPQGYVVYYNELGQPLDIYGQPTGPDATHIPLDYKGPIPGWP